MNEIKMYYNVEDDRYYIYDGEDYIADYTNQESALLCFRLAISETRDTYKEMELINNQLQSRSPFETEDGHLDLDQACEEISFLYKEYGLESDENLTKDAIELKKNILTAVNSIKQLPENKIG